MLKHLIIFTLLFTNTIFANDKALKRISMESEARVALIIGNNDYDSSTLTKLHNPINDARAIRKILSQRNFEVIYIEDASRRIMNKKLKLFYKKIRNGAVGFFYFSGHGLEIDGENYLIPVDAKIEEKDDVDTDSISVDSILKKMQKAGNRLNIAVLDACRNDPFSRGSGGGLAKVEPEGIFVAYATSAGKVASDGRQGTNGLFTKHLIKYMKQDGLGLYDVFKKTRADVYMDSGKKQRPAIYDQVIGEEFFFTLPKDEHINKVVSLKNSTYFSLNINITPRDAQVFITNIKQKYYKGIKLQNGNYNIQVKRDGYLTKEGTITLRGITNIDIVLEKDEVIYSDKLHYSNQKFGKIWQDNDTGLIWQVNIDKKKYIWSMAKEYCENLIIDEKNNWRLPNRKELKTILTNKSYKNAKSLNGKTYIKNSLLKSMNMPWQYFWSETEYKDDFSWYVRFNYGSDNYNGKSSKYYVRCVVDKLR